MDIHMAMSQFIAEDGSFTFPPTMSVPNLAEMVFQLAALSGNVDGNQLDYLDFSSSREGEVRSFTRKEVNTRVKSVAARLQQVGEPGDRVAILMGNLPEYLFAFLGAQYAGQVSVPLYDPTEPGHGDHLAAVLEVAEPVTVLTNRVSAPSVRALFRAKPQAERPRVIVVDALPDTLAGDWISGEADPRYAVRLDDESFLLFTSGSSRTPEGVRVTSGSMLSNVFQIFHAAQLETPLRLVTWLPFHHNMGIVLGAFVTALGLPFSLMAPRDFIQHPDRWVRQLSKRSDEENVYTVVPNFALELANRHAVPAEGDDVDLSRVRGIVVGSEPVTEKATREFIANFSPFGLPDGVIRPSYGLTEATLLVTTPQRPERPRVTWVDRDSLAAGAPERAEAGAAGSVPLMSVGEAAGNQRLIIVDPETREELPDGRIGELWVHGPNIPNGYLTDTEQSARVFGNHLAAALPEGSRAAGADADAEWMATGDLCVFLDGELHVTGRIKDLIIVAGRNHYPQDIEATVDAATDHLRPGVVAAFAIDGADAAARGLDDSVEQLVVIAERDLGRSRDGDAAAADAIRAAVTTGHGIQPADVRIVDAEAIPRSSAGKIARRVCRAAYLDGRYGG
ncbi:FadD32-like long-chain-fatty-acid--AMP ligase [Corynebacterium sp.]|uniref:FadD32-like long-chain-fatty-acid--AMP ligase n=1 Tax=Corynebacterium sp. TaxID=1720 RepID=UPI0026DC730C|nr:FadD32-like long-chain-fatty-acid--AMP ligase [Corynebacterium sp.]MDO4610283.1 FadD32-like long-chain-fatty-acid--AMP ligase [Corynebacterium sp.]